MTKIGGFALRVTLRFVLRFAVPAFCTAFCGAFCTAHPNRGMPRIPFCEAICGDRTMLTTYSPNPGQRLGAQPDYPLPSDLHRRLPSDPVVVAVANPSGRPIITTLACRSGGFRFLVPDSPRLSAAARLADFGGLGISPTQWIAMGLETTKEAI